MKLKVGSVEIEVEDVCGWQKTKGKKFKIKIKSEIWLGNRVGWIVCLVEMMKPLSTLFEIFQFIRFVALKKINWYFN